MKLPAIFTRAALAGAILFGRTKAVSPGTLSGINDRSGWITLIRESYGGAFQQDVVVNHDSVLAQTTIFSCITLIASDISKMRLRLMETDENNISKEVAIPAFSPVLRKPNKYQTAQQFIESWVISKYSRGNTYILKERDARRVVVALHVLDFNRVTPLVAKNGDVYYQLQKDDLCGVDTDNIIAPASEIIHDRMNCLFHPLVGISPIFANGLAATQALNIQNNSAKFFQNMSRPSGILTAPGEISDDTAKRVKDYWEEKFTGENAGKVAVLGDGMKYEAMSATAEDSQLVEQLGWTAEQVCATFHVPKYKIGIGDIPQNVESANQQYYNDCLQSPIEAIENCMDDGLGLYYVSGKILETEFDIDDLLRMDKSAQGELMTKLVKGTVATPNEARNRFNLSPQEGGDMLWMQQQNYSLSALAKRDSKPDPFAKETAAATPPAEPAPAKSDQQAAEEFLAELLKQMEFDHEQ